MQRGEAGAPARRNSKKNVAREKTCQTTKPRPSRSPPRAHPVPFNPLPGGPRLAAAMDIDDILGQLDDAAADSVPQRLRDLQALTRRWVAERSAPELLP